jgi:hypothetical protein
VTANYYLSIILKGEALEICFPVNSGSTLVCFKVRGLISENNFQGHGWIENCSKEKDVSIIVPPHRPGFYLGTTIKGKLSVEAYSKIFWEVPIPVSSINTNWSNAPVYYSSVGSCKPSIAIKETEDGCFIGLGDTPDRAVLNSIHLSRVGEKNLEKECNDFMQRFNGIESKMLRDNIFMAIFNSNSAFIDTEDNCIMASKSPKYYVSGGFWARDFIFWTLPVIERFDQERAKVLLSLLLTKYWKHRGIHSLYLDGRVLYDGFELDQLSYYFLALERAISLKILDPEESLTMASQLMDLLIPWKNYGYYLFGTELNSSDDPVIYPYVTFDNVALWYSMRTYGYKVKELLLDRTYLEFSDKIREDVMNEFVSEDMFCYSSDLKGRYEFYDDPTGSLLLLPYLGFIEKESKVFKNTLKWIKSSSNEFEIRGNFNGLGNRHVKHPWIHSHASQILSGIADESILRDITMDDGLSCETIDQESGRCLTGIHFPGSSGFLVQALLFKSEKDRIRKT